MGETLWYVIDTGFFSKERVMSESNNVSVLKIISVFVASFVVVLSTVFLLDTNSHAATTDIPWGNCVPSVQGIDRMQFARMDCRGRTAHNYGKATAECTLAPDISTDWVGSGQMAQSTVCWWGAKSAYSSYKL